MEHELEIQSHGNESCFIRSIKSQRRLYPLDNENSSIMISKIIGGIH